MTAESDGKGRRGGQPDLLASLPAEHPPPSRPEPGIDPAAIEELLTGVRELREQVAGLREAVSADRPAPVTRELLDALGDDLVARFAEAARTAAKPAAAPGDDASAAHLRRIEEAAARAAAAAERIGGGLDGTADRVATEIGEAVTRMEKGLGLTRNHVDRVSRLVHRALQDIETRVSGRFSKWTIIACLFFFVFGMLIESRTLLLYLWLWTD